jgi:hypothetical protein
MDRFDRRRPTSQISPLACGKRPIMAVSILTMFSVISEFPYIYMAYATS